MAHVSQLAVALRERTSEILAAWIAGFERSRLRFRRVSQAAAHTARVASVLEALVEASREGADELRPGSDATRELERCAAFLGAQIASEGATGFDVAALLIELRDVVVGMTSPDEGPTLTRLFEWLTVVALDGFAASGRQSMREQLIDQLEASTPMCELLPKVPALLLVGAPGGNALHNLLARVWMLAVGTGAPCVIIDCSGLAEVDEGAFEHAYRAFLAQAAGSTVQVLISGARPPVRNFSAAATLEAGLSLQQFDRLDLAVAYALERAGYLLMRA